MWTHTVHSRYSFPQESSVRQKWGFILFWFFFTAGFAVFQQHCSPLSFSPSQWHQSHSACITLTTWGIAYSMGSVLLRRLHGLKEQDMGHASSTVCDSVGLSGLIVRIHARHIYPLFSLWSFRLLYNVDSQIQKILFSTYLLFVYGLAVKSFKTHTTHVLYQ